MGLYAHGALGNWPAFPCVKTALVWIHFLQVLPSHIHRTTSINCGLFRWSCYEFSKIWLNYIYIYVYIVRGVFKIYCIFLSSKLKVVFEFHHGGMGSEITIHVWGMQPTLATINQWYIPCLFIFGSAVIISKNKNKNIYWVT